jgi:F-box and WD-40 domain protein 5
VLFVQRTLIVIYVLQVCRTWYRLTGDDYLWRELLYRKWKINRAIRRRSGASSWRSEYRRLVYCAPTELSEVLKSHTDQVLHVVFAHGGHSFATTSKDGFIKVTLT